MSVLEKARMVVPGLTIAILVAGSALALEEWAIELTGQRWVDALVLSILVGMATRTALGLRRDLKTGVDFAAKTVLEIAIVLLGATISISALGKAGWVLALSIVVIVLMSLVISYCFGRAFGLSDNLATLIACGNSICGNSAIVAAGPVIGAQSDEIAASIGFTAVLGILVVLLLPLIQAKLEIDQYSYGVLAGMTVYAVPQVVAATAAVGTISVQIGTMVKLTRVLMLGPVILLLGLKVGRTGSVKLPLRRLVPWFLVGFGALIALRSAGMVPETMLPALEEASLVLTLIAIAALGLSVNVRTVLSSGGKVLLVGILSLLALGLISFAALTVLPLGA